VNTGLERDAQEPEHEPALEAQVGPLLSRAFSHVALTLSGGLAVLRYRDSAETVRGLAVTFGVRTAL
jgi:hypothetical protein